MATKQTKAQTKSIVLFFAYLLTWLSGIIVYITAGQSDKRAKFHALQAIFLGVIAFIIGFIPIISLLSILIWLYGLYIGWKAYDGQDVMIPVLGDYAKQYSR